MKLKQSATPYLLFLLVLVGGIPFVESLLQAKAEKEAVEIEVQEADNESAMVQKKLTRSE